jgi:FkbM family methyltransferase
MDAKEVVHRSLIRTAGASGNRILRPLWRRANDLATRRWGDQEVRVDLHGTTATINFANPYPHFVRRYPNYNAPQVELVALASAALGRPVTVIDVGAAVGDTALLLLHRCGRQIGALECVEGEPRFAGTLRKNLTDPRTRVHQVVLSDVPGVVPGLVRGQHEGTASAHGDIAVVATTLDQEFPDVAPDVIKVDTDGFDGAILSGGRGLLESFRPAVLFEWHPKACAVVGTDYMRPLKVLREAGYERWIFFNKYGQFNHFGLEHVEELARLCLTTTTLPDWHYDVAALHPSSEIDAIALADLRYWGRAGHP